VGAVFLGTHTPRLDDKGRLAMPARFRADLEGGLVITKGQERCLFAFPIAEFTRLTELLRVAPMTDRRIRNYSRIFFASASQEMPDGQGRITVPQQLRQYAGLEKDCVVIGANTRVEIWDAVAWQDYLESTEQNFSDADEEVLPGLF
jgi:MraZ protein